MVCDHIGLALAAFFPYDMNAIQVSNVLRGFGRLALPLFIFMIVEGVIHTKSIKKYLLRLGVMAGLITTILIIITYVNFGDGFNLVSLQGVGNIFIDLFPSDEPSWQWCLRTRRGRRSAAARPRRNA